MTNTQQPVTLNKPVKTGTTEKYTAEQTESLLKQWNTFCESTPNWKDTDRQKADDFIESLAVQFQKSIKSITGKLTRHLVYVAKTAPKKSSGSLTKTEYADAIGKVLNLTEAETQSLAVAGKGALKKIFEALAASRPIEILTPAQEKEKREIVDSIIEILPIDSSGIIDLQSLQSSTLCDILGGLKDMNETVQSLEGLQIASNQAE